MATEFEEGLNSTENHNPDVSKRSRLVKVNRRSALKTIGAAGAIATGFSQVPIVKGHSGETVEIVTLMNGNQIVQTRRVGQQWFNHTRRAYTARDELSQTLRHREDVHTIGIGRGSSMIGGLQSHNLDVMITPDGTTDGIPEEVGGIPVNVERNSRAIPTCYTGYHDPIEGGVSFSSNWNGGEGTLCCRVKDYRNGSWRKYILGARHTFMSFGDACSNENASGLKWSQYTTAGKVVEGFQHHDCALLDTSETSRDIVDDIIDEDGNMDGRVTGDGLSYLKSNNEIVQKRGRTTCKSSGEIKKIMQEIFCPNGNYMGGVVRSGTDAEDGDSGGPVYYEIEGSPDELYLVNIATHRPGDGSGDTKGSSANSMNEKQGFWFGGNPYSGN